MIYLKPGVLLSQICPQMVFAIHLVNEAYREFGCPCTITSVNDGKHGPKTLHFRGQAVDFRLHNVPEAYRGGLVKQIKEALNHGQGQFEVYHEAIGTPNEHLHVEYDPK